MYKYNALSDGDIVDFSDLNGTNGTFKFAVSNDVLPYVYQRNGKLTGFEPALLYEFCKARGYKPEIIETQFNAVVAGISSGKYDMGIYRLVLLVEEILVSIITINADRIKNLNIFIEYNERDGNSKVNLYLDGGTEKAPFDELREKIFNAYCSNIRYIENDEGYDMHISFDVNSK